MDRRVFLGGAAAALGGVGMSSGAIGAMVARAATGPAQATGWQGASGVKLPDLRISRILVQDTKGRRLTPVARNAYADYRGYDVSETILRIRTANGQEGVARAATSNPALLRRLIGLDAVDLFRWSGDRITGPAPEHAALLAELGGTDVALVDLIGRAMKKPAYALLGQPVRDQIAVYDSSLYMEDLLTPAQLKDVAYLQGRGVPNDPVQLPAIKAEWILRTRSEGIKSLKIKTGRSRWMETPEIALQRDIAITRAIRAAVGPDIQLMVDANKDYRPAPERGTVYAAGVKDARIYMLEELFPETQTDALIALRRALRAADDPVKLAYGESHDGGVPEQVFKRRVSIPGGRTEPLVDIEQADMNAHGFLYLRTRAQTQQPLGMTMAPHNFGSKMGLYSMVHLAMVVPNWEICELDDSMFPGIRADGIQIRDGVGRCTGSPGLGVALVEDHMSPPKVDLS